MNCEPCTHNNEHGWHGLSSTLTHCRDCHVTFPSSNRWGHCSRCHQTFSGSQSFDLHQRVTKEGDIAPDCLCTVAMTHPAPESREGALSLRRWDVNSSTIVEKVADWGIYWGQLKPEVFA